jgi:Ran GTPase-activating protein (RanGAP) involved in mRNA processing and transport
LKDNVASIDRDNLASKTIWPPLTICDVRGNKLRQYERQDIATLRPRKRARINVTPELDSESSSEQEEQEEDQAEEVAEEVSVEVAEEEEVVLEAEVAAEPAEPEEQPGGFGSKEGDAVCVWADPHGGPKVYVAPEDYEVSQST